MSLWMKLENSLNNVSKIDWTSLTNSGLYQIREKLFLPFWMNHIHMLSCLYILLYCLSTNKQTILHFTKIYYFLQSYNYIVNYYIWRPPTTRQTTSSDSTEIYFKRYRLNNDKLSEWNIFFLNYIYLRVFSALGVCKQIPETRWLSGSWQCKQGITCNKT